MIKICHSIFLHFFSIGKKFVHLCWHYIEFVIIYHFYCCQYINYQVQHCHSVIDLVLKQNQSPEILPENFQKFFTNTLNGESVFHLQVTINIFYSTTAKISLLINIIFHDIKLTAENKNPTYVTYAYVMRTRIVVT